MPNISLNYKTNLFNDSENKDTSNYVLDIKNGNINRGQFDKSVIGSSSKGLIHRIKKDYNSNITTNFIDNLQYIITEYMKTTGFSVGINDLLADDTTNSDINEIIENKKEVSNIIDKLHLNIFENKSGKSNNEYFETEVNNILNKATNDAGNVGIRSLDKDQNRFVSLVTSGSKGSNINISQMISCLGQQNIDGKRIPYGYTNRTLPHFKQFDDSPFARGFVESSFIEGLTPEELYFHAMGGRTGLIDTAVKTSSTGYIQRRLIKSMEDIQVMYDNSIRNNKQKIIQFSYGNTNFDTTHIETLKFPLINMNITDIYKRYGYSNESSNKSQVYLKLIYNSSTLNRFKTPEHESSLKIRAKKDIDFMIKSRNHIIKNVLEYNKKNRNLFTNKF